MGDMRRTQAVGWAISVSEACVVFMLCTWRSADAAEGGEGKGEVGGSSWAIRAARTLWVRLQASVRHSGACVTHMEVWGRNGGR